MAIAKLDELLLGFRAWSKVYFDKVNEIVDAVNDIIDSGDEDSLVSRVEDIEGDLDATKEGSLAAQVDANTQNLDASEVGSVAAQVAANTTAIGSESDVGSILYRIKALEDAQ